ncbi:MAG: HNH endonuclease [Verrucomicrobia bacterium]|nr:HNH endonuclease [Verrucomicrobiota bacterium]
MPITREQFREAILERFRQSFEQGLTSITIRSGDLHRELGDFPGPDQRMPMLCDEMRELRRSGDEVLESPPSGQGATLMIRYALSKERIENL